MLKIQTKEYEVQEDIVIEDKDGNELYKFEMSLTADEVSEIKKLILDAESMKLVKQQKKAKEELKDKLEDEIMERAEHNQTRFEKICLKEHQEKIKGLVSEYYYNELIDSIFNFFWNTFIKKRAAQANTMISDLQTNGKN